MGLFKKKQPVFDVRVFHPGEIVMVNGVVYLVTPDHLQQLAVKTINQREQK